MRVFVSLLLALAVSCTAEPVRVVDSLPAVVDNDATKNIITDLVASLLEGVSQTIRDEGLDPLILLNAETGYALPVPSLFSITARTDEFVATGISDIVVNNMNYGLLSGLLTFDFSLPRITVVGDGEVDVVVLSKKYNGAGFGSLTVENIGLRGNARISIGLSGISVRSLDFDFYLGGLKSHLQHLELLGNDVTDDVNNFINNDLFQAIVNHQADISELIEIIAWRLIEENL